MSGQFDYVTSLGAWYDKEGSLHWEPRAFDCFAQGHAYHGPCFRSNSYHCAECCPTKGVGTVNAGERLPVTSLCAPGGEP